MSTFSAFTTDLKKRPELLEQMKREAAGFGPRVTVRIHGNVTTVTATDY